MTDLQLALYLDMVVARLDVAYDALNEVAPTSQIKEEKLIIGVRRYWPPIEPLRDLLGDLRLHAEQLKKKGAE